MKLTRQQQRSLVQLWDRTGQELDRIRRENLKGMPYRWEDVDALLELGEFYNGSPRLSSGLVTMQRLFSSATRKRS